MFSKKHELRAGEYTKTVYTLINEQRYADAIAVLCKIPESTSCRAGLSLLGHCYFQCQEFIEAANCYEQLILLVPNEPEYKLAYAHSLFQSGLLEEAFKVTLAIIDAPHIKERILQLQSTIRYFNEEYSNTQALLAQRNAYHESTLNDEGCLLYQANVFDEALQRFTAALQSGGFNPLIAYNAALCHYRRKENTQALNYIAEIVERGIRNYPELGIGAQTENEGGARSVGNPPSLAASGLTQCLNLKAAIEYGEGNIDGAREALMDLPPRTEPELDPVTLHNLALTDTSGIGTSLRRLAFLLEIGPPTCPPETFANILLLCCKHEMYDTAADILAEQAHLTYKYLSTYLYDLLDAIITVQTSREDADQKLSKLSARLAGRLRSLTGKIQEYRTTNNDAAVKKTLREYEEELANFLPVAMARAWLYWLEDDFATAEREFRESAEFCSESPLWRLHAAHVLFMRGDKYKEAIAFYEPIVPTNYADILSVSAAVLGELKLQFTNHPHIILVLIDNDFSSYHFAGNLCVSYIMTSQNEEAEDLMRKVERAEELKGNATGHCLHLCIVNLVIGTLYCAKGNYEFGLSRIAHALDSATAGSRLCPDTWFHVKRCVLGLLTGMAKQTVILPSFVVDEVLNLLHTCQVYGISIPASFETSADENADEPPTIGLEARKLHALLIKAIEYE